MTTEQNNNGDAVAAFDQIGTTLENAAVIFGNYYKRLLREGVPNELAEQMTRDMQATLFARLMTPTRLMTPK